MSVSRIRQVLVAVCLVGGCLPSTPAAAADGSAGISSREQMVREWDLNRDGTIDEGEAEIARSKMRRQQAELKARAVAGRRVEQRDAAEQPERGATATNPRDPVTDDPPPRRPRDRDRRGDRPADTRREGQADAPAAVTGGARAGGLARPGYGSTVPRGELNAGRPIPPRTAGERPPMTGGLLPTPRRGATAPPAAPVARPRVTADDFPY